MNSQTLGWKRVISVIFSVLLLISCITLFVTGSLWISKQLQEPLRDTYNIVLYGIGRNTSEIHNYIKQSSFNTLNDTQIDSAISRTPSIIFRNVTASDADLVIHDLRNLGAVVGAA